MKFSNKYKNFEDYFLGEKLTMSFAEYDQQEKGWDAAINNYPKNEQNNVIAEQIKELLNTINDSEKIDCTCDQVQIASGFRCGCGRGQAIIQSGMELGIYLKQLRKNLK